jgi:23S rRNA (uridine2552-2'-O)-methyltransferase
VNSTARIIALDILPMEPIEGVSFLQGDFREDAVLQQLERLLAGRPVDVVVSDMAPNLSGIAVGRRGAHRTWSNWRWISPSPPAPRGALVCKAFHGSGYSQLVKLFKTPSGSSSRSSPRPRATSRRKPFWSASV